MQFFHLCYAAQLGILSDRFCRLWFWIDLISVLPFDILALFYTGEAIKQLKVVRIIRLLRLIKLIRVMRASRTPSRTTSSGHKILL